MTTHPTASTYYVSVEEFVPRTDAKYMLQLATNLEQLKPEIRDVDFSGLKRTMAWMERYIVPSMEFWGWPDERFSIDGDTGFALQTIGFGWVAIVYSREPVSEKSLSKEEERLIGVMNRLTKHIPIKAILRIKASPWDKKELKKVRHELTIRTHPCEIRETACCFSEHDIRIDTKSGELLNCSNITRDVAKKVESVLAIMKDYANRRNEGSVWCAYQRRRLTLVHKIGSDELENEDVRFLSNPEDGRRVEIITSRITAEGLSALVGFPKAKYHEGNLHPRAIIASHMPKAALMELSTYIYYLWNTHYTKIWLYMLFEDLYAYADNLRTQKQYIDPEIDQYWQHLLGADDIILEMETHERIDDGKVPSYIPPHDKYVEVEEVPTPGILSSAKPLAWLRHHLIQATTTELTNEPLVRARKLLVDIESYMKTALNLFVQTRSIRMQQILHVIQLLFVVGAMAEVMQVVGPISIRIVEKSSLLTKALNYIGVQTPIPADSLLPNIANLVILIVLSILGIVILRRSGVGRWISNLIK